MIAKLQTEMNSSNWRMASSPDGSGQAIRPLKNKLYTHEIAMRVNFSQTQNDYMAIPCDN